MPPASCRMLCSNGLAAKLLQTLPPEPLSVDVPGICARQQNQNPGRNNTAVVVASAVPIGHNVTASQNTGRQGNNKLNENKRKQRTRRARTKIKPKPKTQKKRTVITYTPARGRRESCREQKPIRRIDTLHLFLSCHFCLVLTKSLPWPIMSR